MGGGGKKPSSGEAHQVEPCFPHCSAFPFFPPPASLFQSRQVGRGKGRAERETKAIARPKGMKWAGSKRLEQKTLEVNVPMLLISWFSMFPGQQGIQQSL